MCPFSVLGFLAVEKDILFRLSLHIKLSMELTSKRIHVVHLPLQASNWRIQETAVDTETYNAKEPGIRENVFFSARLLSTYQCVGDEWFRLCTTVLQLQNLRITNSGSLCWCGT
jgi:hypothetical protein